VPLSRKYSMKPHFICLNHVNTPCLLVINSHCFNHGSYRPISKVASNFIAKMYNKSRQKNVQNSSKRFIASSSGWWLTYPFEKYESQLGWWFTIYGKIKCSEPPTSVSSQFHLHLLDGSLLPCSVDWIPLSQRVSLQNPTTVYVFKIILRPVKSHKTY
jgi:hypothetical protein